MASSNPFIYGEIVAAGAFADRDEEYHRLTEDLRAGQKVFLISPRRYGKSSLIRRALDSLARERVITVSVTVAGSSSYVGFLEAYAQALIAAETPIARFRQWAGELMRSMRPEITVDPGGSDRPGAPSLSLSFPTVRTSRDAGRLAAEVFALPGRIAAARKRPVAIALDEFQTIASFDEGSVEEALRAAVQQQRDVGYVFAGSEPSLMDRMISPRRPFYKAGPVMRLQKIDPADFAEWLEARFAKSGLRAESGLGAAIVDLADNVPYDVQRLAHETWDDVKAAGRKAVGVDDLHATLSRILRQQGIVFEESWQRLTLAQRGVLRALVLEGGEELLSADVRQRHRLAGASSVQSSLAALIREDIVMRDGSRYMLTDSLYREWIARKTF
ncbi:MAG: ATP-binding protein [Acidobacteria bacterium]|nr:MAG: ATP-binding protein [Acidobacteriota bacterium]